MSYCRFSCDDCLSNVYAYQDVELHYVVYVASSTPVFEVDLPPEVPIEPGREEEWVERHIAVSNLVRDAKRRSLDLPYAGTRNLFKTPYETFQFLLELRSLGYHVPQRALDLLERESGGV